VKYISHKSVEQIARLITEDPDIINEMVSLRYGPSTETIGRRVSDSELLEENIDRFISPEDDDLLDVDTAFEAIKNVQWDSGFTPLQVYERLAENEPVDENYDIQSVRFHMKQLQSGNIQSIEVDDDGITDGYHRIVAAKMLGLKGLPYHWPE